MPTPPRPYITILFLLVLLLFGAFGVERAAYEQRVTGFLTPVWHGSSITP